MAGILYGVGVGPGDPELMTLKAVKCIETCDIIGIPAKDTISCTAWQIAAGAVPGLAEKEVLAVAIPMTKDSQKTDAAYAEGASRLSEKLKEGKNIAFLNLGDPTLYGTYMEFHKRIIAAGLKAQIISGVPSVCAVAARLGVSLGERGEPIHILPGSYDTEELLKLSGTRVIMKSAGETKRVRDRLTALCEETGQEAMAVANCGMPGEKVYRRLAHMEEDPGYFTTFLVKEAK